MVFHGTVSEGLRWQDIMDCMEEGVANVKKFLGRLGLKVGILVE
jgi:hypothetical protein